MKTKMDDNTFKNQPKSAISIREAQGSHPGIDRFSEAVRDAANKEGNIHAIVFAVQHDGDDTKIEGENRIVAGNLVTHNVDGVTLMAFGHTILSHPLMRKAIDMAMRAIKSSGEENKNDGDDE